MARPHRALWILPWAVLLASVVGADVARWTNERRVENTKNFLDQMFRMFHHGRDSEALRNQVRMCCKKIAELRTQGTIKQPDEELANFLRGRKVAIAYFGLTRSLTTIICNLYTRLYAPLESVGIEVHSYMHTYDLTHLAASKRNPEERAKSQLLLPNERLLLPLNEMVTTNQSAFREGVDIKDFLPTAARKTKEDHTVLWNLISQYNSLEQVTDLWKKSGVEYDVILYVRPDMAWLGPFPLDVLRRIIEERDGVATNTSTTGVKQEVFAAASWMSSRGINDRFGAGTPLVMEHFGRRIAAAKQYLAEHDTSLHAEAFLAGHMHRFGSREDVNMTFLSMIHVPMVRVRHACGNPQKFQDAFRPGWRTGDPIIRKACMVAHQDCEAFPFLEGQPEDELFLPSYETVEDTRTTLPKGKTHSRLCDSSEGLCKPLTWTLRARYVLSQYTEPDFVLWAREKGWGKRVFRTKKLKNGTVIEYVIPTYEHAHFFVRRVAS